MKNDGGPAFPVPGALADSQHHGLSLRDWLAGQALVAIVAKQPLFDRDGEFGPKFDEITLAHFRRDMAISAYEWADAMLKERSRE